MTPAELKTARHRLGYSITDLATALSTPDPPPRIAYPDRLAGQVNQRTVRRWEDGTWDIPGPVVVAVGFMLREMARGKTK